MVQTLASTSSSTDRDTVHLRRHLAFASQRARLVEERRRAASQIVAVDAKLDVLDSEIAALLAVAVDAKLDVLDSEIAALVAAASSNGASSSPNASKAASNRRAAAKKGATRPRVAEQISAKPGAKKALAKKAAPARTAAPARVAQTGGTSDTILKLLGRRPTKTMSPVEVVAMTGLNTSLVAKTLQRLAERGSIVRADKGAYMIAPRGW